MSKMTKKIKIIKKNVIRPGWEIQRFYTHLWQTLVHWPDDPLFRFSSLPSSATKKREWNNCIPATRQTNGFVTQLGQSHTGAVLRTLHLPQMNRQSLSGVPLMRIREREQQTWPRPRKQSQARTGLSWRPADPWGSSGGQSAPQSWSHLEWENGVREVPGKRDLSRVPAAFTTLRLYST